MASSDLAITAQERTNVLNGNLEAFWRSRLSKKDPVARIGYALWVTDTTKLKHVIQSGDTNFWNIGITKGLLTGSLWLVRL
ncbi:hypothetical protein ACROAE_17575 [Shewanella sp. MF05960]|uniref:hypothetical protein n=1 Tax=Shewanella sp. MF05960 TaxID=3434874 RepID=UPI003D7C07A6